MKKTVILAAAICLFSVSASYAQDGTPKPEQKKERGSRGGFDRMKMYEDLNLSKEQSDSIKKIDEQEGVKMKALREDSVVSDEDKRAKMGEMRKVRQEKINAILTPEQKAKLDEKIKKMREERGQARNMQM